MKPLLAVRDLRKRLGGVDVLRELGLTLHDGEFVGLIGPNGSGKTTLLRCLCGVLAADTGAIWIDGVASDTDPRGAKSRLGFAPDPTLLPAELTGRQALELFAAARDLAGVPGTTFELAERLGFSRWLDARVERYSLGTRQKLSILLGLIGEPPLLLLDEPLNGLDPLSAFELKQHLSERVRSGRGAVLLATHALDVAERFINRALLMLDGRIVREWDAAALGTLRAAHSSLEEAMVGALRERTPGPTLL